MQKQLLILHETCCTSRSFWSSRLHDRARNRRESTDRGFRNFDDIHLCVMDVYLVIKL